MRSYTHDDSQGQAFPIHPRRLLPPDRLAFSASDRELYAAAARYCCGGRYRWRSFHRLPARPQPPANSLHTTYRRFPARECIFGTSDRIYIYIYTYIICCLRSTLHPSLQKLRRTSNYYCNGSMRATSYSFLFRRLGGDALRFSRFSMQYI